jgi:hypothetical protein
MTIREVALIEKLIDLKLERLNAATKVAMTNDMTERDVLRLMLPIEEQIEKTLMELRAPN